MITKKVTMDFSEYDSMVKKMQEMEKTLDDDNRVYCWGIFGFSSRMIPESQTLPDAINQFISMTTPKEFKRLRKGLKK